jgi:hydroxymethylpyrimidine/phosphomethylpyrimidine kinase
MNVSVSEGAGNSRPCVLVFAGLDPSGGAGLTADLQAIAGQEAHALTVCTALTVQDNDRVLGVQPVDVELVLRQAQALADKMVISAIKIGITGSAANARAIAQFIVRLRERGQAGGSPLSELPVVLDPVLASGHGDLLSRDDAVQALAPLLPLATVLTPNGPEAQALTDGTQADMQAQALRALGCRHVLITGGHGDGDEIINRWYGPGTTAITAAGSNGALPRALLSASRGATPCTSPAASPCTAPSATSGTAPGAREWRWPRLAGAFHGSGCTLASAIAAQLALGLPTAVALEHAQHYVYHALRDAYAIAPGQRIPLR